MDKGFGPKVREDPKTWWAIIAHPVIRNVIRHYVTTYSVIIWYSFSTRNNMARKRTVLHMTAAAYLLTAVFVYGYASEDENDFFKSLMKKDVPSILSRFVFISDTEQKTGKRHISDEIYWRYPFTVAPFQFDIPEKIDTFENAVKVTRGQGRGLEYMNQARVHMINGELTEAATYFNMAKQQTFDSEYINRRIYFYLGLVHLQMAHDKGKEIGYQHGSVKAMFSDVTTYFGTAFRPPMNVKDPELDKYTPTIFYTMASIYHSYGNFPEAYKTAMEGLEHLAGPLKEERLRGYRNHLRRMVATSLTKNGSLHDAISEYEMAIREHQNGKFAGEDFHRVADIFYDLNNFSQAENIYGLSLAVNQREGTLNTIAAIFRGESLFWLGRFKEAKYMFEYAVRGILKRNANQIHHGANYRLAKLRLADIDLHMASVASSKKKRDELLGKAKLGYFQLTQLYQRMLVGKIARLRSSCLELPYYNGHNVDHARSILSKMEKDFSLPPEARELAMACYVGSYTERERTPLMVEKVSAFVKSYPRSRFLGKMIEPVKEVKSSILGALFRQGKTDEALSFYEKNVGTLFPQHLSNKDRANLFKVYFSKGKVKKARPFWDAFYEGMRNSDMDRSKLGLENLLMAATFLEEASSVFGASPTAASPAAVSPSAASPRVSTLETADNDGDVNKYGSEEGMAFEELLTGVYSRISELSITLGDIPSFYLTRLRLADEDLSSYPFLIESYMNAAFDENQLCETYLPLVSRLLAKGPEHLPKDHGAFFKATMNSIVEGKVKSDLCTAELFGFERSYLRYLGEEKELADLWYTRLSNWMSDKEKPKFLKDSYPFLWSASEYYYSKRNEDGEPAEKAETIWKYLVDNAPEDTSEHRFATARLDKERGELSDLWD